MSGLINQWNPDCMDDIEEISRALQDNESQLIEILSEELWMEWDKQGDPELDKKIKIRIGKQIHFCTSGKSEWVLFQTPRIEDSYAFVNQPPIKDEIDVKIRICINKEIKGVPFICKSVSKIVQSEQNNQFEIKNLFHQIRSNAGVLFATTDSPQFLPIFQVFEEEKWVHSILEYCPRGDLESWIFAQKENLSEEQIFHWFGQILKAVYSLNQAGRPHTRLNLNEILLKGKKTDDMDAMNGSRIILNLKGQTNEKYIKKTKTRSNWFYFAPEQFKGMETEKTDVWALGVILYTLAYRYPPFFSTFDNYGQFKKEMKEQIFSGLHSKSKSGPGPHFRKSKRYDISDELKDLIQKMIQPSTIARNCLAECCCHPWMLAFASSSRVEVQLAEDLMNFNLTSHVARIIMEGLMYSKFIPEESFSMYRRMAENAGITKNGELTKLQLQFLLKRAVGSFSSEESEKLISYFIQKEIGDVNTKDSNNSTNLAPISIDELVIAQVMVNSRIHVHRLSKIFPLLETSGGDGMISKDKSLHGFLSLLGSNVSENKLSESFLHFLDSKNTGNINYYELLQHLYDLTSFEQPISFYDIVEDLSSIKSKEA